MTITIDHAITLVQHLAWPWLTTSTAATFAADAAEVKRALRAFYL